MKKVKNLKRAFVALVTLASLLATAMFAAWFVAAWTLPPTQDSWIGTGFLLMLMAFVPTGLAIWVREQIPRSQR